MQIYPYSQNFYIQNSNRQSFTSNAREIRDNKTGDTYRTTTYILRDDLNWHDFSDLLMKKYKDADKVNVLNHACSNGLEPMSLVMSLLMKFGVKAEKFFPIIAKDRNSTNIIMAKNNEPFDVDNKDLEILSDFTNDNYDMFFKTAFPTTMEATCALKPKSVLTSRIKYSQGNLLEDVKNLPPKNNVVLCRNVWLYLKPEEQEELAKSLSENIDETGLVVIGYFDEKESAAAELLNKYGFRETSVEYVYEKVDNSVKGKTRLQDARLYPTNLTVKQKR